jgi:protein TonB
MADAPEPNAAPQDQDATPAALIANLEASRERGQPPAATTVTPPPAQAAATGGTPDARAALLSQIKQQVMTNLDYPLRARRQGWQGQVLLDFRVGETGALDHIQLAQSSGHVLLDRSALRALGLVQRITLPADYPAGLVLQLQLPVIFRLQEG